MSLDRFTQLFPVHMQRFVSDSIKIFFIGINRQNTFRIGGFVKPWACALLFCQLVRSLQQVILNRFKGFVSQVIGAAVRVAFTVFRQPVSVVDHANTQRTTTHRTAFGGRNRIILVIEQRIQRTYSQYSQLFQFVQTFDSAQVKCGQRTQRNFAVFIVNVGQRFGRQGDFQAQVGLAYRRDNRIKRAVGVAVVNVLNVDTTGRGTFLHHQ